MPWRLPTRWALLLPSPPLWPCTYGKFHGRKSLAGYSPRGCKESDTTEQLHQWTSSRCWARLLLTGKWKSCLKGNVPCLLCLYLVFTLSLFFLFFLIMDMWICDSGLVNTGMKATAKGDRAGQWKGHGCLVTWLGLPGGLSAHVLLIVLSAEVTFLGFGVKPHWCLLLLLRKSPHVNLASEH